MKQTEVKKGYLDGFFIGVVLVMIGLVLNVYFSIPIQTTLILVITLLFVLLIMKPRVKHHFIEKSNTYLNPKDKMLE